MWDRAPHLLQEQGRCRFHAMESFGVPELPLGLNGAGGEDPGRRVYPGRLGVSARYRVLSVCLVPGAPRFEFASIGRMTPSMRSPIDDACTVRTALGRGRAVGSALGGAL